jgi:hypothetical protein
MLVTASARESEQDSPYEREEGGFTSFVLTLEYSDWGLKWTECVLCEVSEAIDI